MNLIKHDAQGATIHLDQRELLMAMALIQEGRDAFECNGQTGRALDRLFSSANVVVEEARREKLKKNMVRCKVGTVATAESEQKQQKDGSNG